MKQPTAALISLSLTCGLMAISIRSLQAQPTGSQGANPAVVGLWETVDDTTGKPASVVRTFLVDGKLRARVEKIIRPDAPADKRCTKCDGDNKDKPVQGMTIIWDLAQDGDTWEGGHVLDPDNGTVYRCKVKAVGATDLEVRGFVGISLFGRSQVWHRLPEPAAAGATAPAKVEPTP